MADPPSARTVAELKKMPYQPCSVKDELRRNVIAALRTGKPLFPGIVGYRETVIPEIVNGILSRHDMLFLGLRGQAKTRLLRMLPDLLDPWIPVLAQCEIPDDLPFIHASCRGKIELMLAEGESAEDKLVTSLIGEAVKLVFSRHADMDAFDDICRQFKGGLTLQAGDEVSTATMLGNYAHIKGLKAAAARMAGKLGMASNDSASLVSAGEFILEGLYVNNRLSKVNMPGKTFFRK